MFKLGSPPGYFLDVLQTKGDNGVKKFLEILEWEYPHVYKDVTNKEARDPPTGKSWGGMAISLVNQIYQLFSQTSIWREKFT